MPNNRISRWHPRQTTERDTERTSNRTYLNALMTPHTSRGGRARTYIAALSTLPEHLIDLEEAEVRRRERANSRQARSSACTTSKDNQRAWLLLSYALLQIWQRCSGYKREVLEDQATFQC